jgi:uncharacterized protein (TIGR03000 family)
MQVVPVPATKPMEASAARAKVVVQMPADAKLYVDDYLTKNDGKAERVFNTPALEAGKDYFYVLKAETVKDGQPVTETKRIVVRAGEEARASFAAPAVAVTAK